MSDRVFIIAEAGVNHNGSLELAMQLIDIAKNAGADAVKFQTFKAEKVVSRAAVKAAYQVENTGNNDSQYDMIKKLELSYDDHVALVTYCKKKEIEFMSAPFDMESIDTLISLDVKRIKVPSGEITNLPYLRKIATAKKPVILSTGMSGLDEIKEAVRVLFNNGSGISRKEITILHCNTEYPTPYSDVNLLAMQTIQKELGVKIGYSDHTPGIEVPVAAVALGASVIEKHFTISRDMEGPDHIASLEPAELKQMVEAIRHVEMALGSNEKKVSASEQKNIAIARKSIHLARAVKKGAVIQEADLEMKRPGDGISPMRMTEVVGKRFADDFEAEHKLGFQDIE